MSSEYKYTKEMREISGFGGGYEEACRKMVIAGLEWCDKHPEVDPQLALRSDDNDNARALIKAIVDASGGDCTWAMHQATITHILFIKKNGWNKYVQVMKKD